MPRNVDQSVLTREAGMKCLCLECPHKAKCSFASTLWAAKSSTIKYGKFYPFFITVKCDRRENELPNPIFSMSQLHLFFAKFGVEHLCDECPDKAGCEFRYLAAAARDVAETQKFNPWHVVYKCLKIGSGTKEVT